MQAPASIYKTENRLAEEAIGLLKQLIAIPSFSGQENEAAGLVEAFLLQSGIAVSRHINNIWACNKYFDPSLPTILLNSHLDTVKPGPGYTRDPFNAEIEDEKLFGLGSNDAGGCVVTQLAVFQHFYGKKKLRYNLVYSATAEEEISGDGGIISILAKLPVISFAIVGEPTGMNLAIAEKGLMVIDCIAYGKAGHAARDEGQNSIYKALKDIQWFRDFSFPKVSDLLGPVKMNVTMINAGSAHNVVPALCRFTVDVRTTDMYSNEEVLRIIQENISSEPVPRSMRLNPLPVPADHPFVKAGLEAGRKIFGSSTTSDKSLVPFPAVKIGPGDSARSHSADEFIYVHEISEGIEIFIKMLSSILC